MLSTGLPFLCPKAGRRAWAMSKSLCILQLAGSISTDTGTPSGSIPLPAKRQMVLSRSSPSSKSSSGMGSCRSWSRWVVDSNSPNFRDVSAFLWPHPGLTPSGAESSKGDNRASPTVLHWVPCLPSSVTAISGTSHLISPAL